VEEKQHWFDKKTVLNVKDIRPFNNNQKKKQMQ